MSRLLFLMPLLFLSCQPQKVSKNAAPSQSTKNIMPEGYRKSPNDDSSRILWFKTEQSVNATVPWFIYFVTDQEGKQIILKENRVLAEKIYWKDKNTLAIIPYREVMQEESLENPIDNEIIIKIK